MNKNKCDLCHQDFPESELITGMSIRDSLMKYIILEKPDFNTESMICKDDLDLMREAYIQNVIKHEKGSLEQLDRDVVESLKSHKIISRQDKGKIKKETFGALMSDRIAKFGGSWYFILSFMSFIIIWIIFNTVQILSKNYDPYPYILLNLILSCIASLQAPIIMMSQNRQELKDRKRAENDYKIDLKSEIEIRMLHEKLDHLLNKQIVEIMKIHQIQIDMLEEINKELKQLKRDAK